MGVEKWLYEKLGRPGLTPVGEVLTDLFDGKIVDWINVGASSNSGVRQAKQPLQFSSVKLRGGCDLDALAHYFRSELGQVEAETNYIKGPQFVRMDTTTNLIFALKKQAEAVQQLAEFGLAEEDTSTRFFNDVAPDTLLVLTTWADVFVPVYQSKNNGFRYSFSLPYGLSDDLTQTTHADIKTRLANVPITDERRQEIHEMRDLIINNFLCLGTVDEKTIEDNFLEIMHLAPHHTRLCIVLPHAHRSTAEERDKVLLYNSKVKELLSRYEDVNLLDMADYMNGWKDIQDFWNHLDRMAYFRLYQAVRNLQPPLLEEQANFGEGLFTGSGAATPLGLLRIGG